MVNLYFAAVNHACESGGILTFPHWWQYLHKGAFDNSTNCSVIHFKFPGDLFAVALAILDILIYLAGFVAVVMIVVAGINYMLASGNSEKITSSRKSIINSIVGLAIAMVGAGVVSFIGSVIKGS